MKPQVRLVKIIRIESLSPHLRRIVFSSEQLAGFPEGKEGAHVKVLVPHEGEKYPELAFDAPRPAFKRSYTIRSFNAQTLELAIDFVVNRHDGPATNWAVNAKVGDFAGIAGPGAAKLTDFSQENYLLIGDLTSVNAVNGFAKYIPKHSTLKSVITVPTRSDIISMDAGEHLEVDWHIEDEATHSFEDMVEAAAKTLPNDKTHVFFGLEARSVRTIKGMLLHDLQYDRLNLFATGYWKKGIDADKFNRQKQAAPL
ncbi:siderophore-interacting protein [Paraglaciecola agarilytica]|jgi:NADPH-dependent ferric siderophore reductase|uniref:Siderophore-interacting protein n=1 Tax=Paraglaciecola chathamensis TaxID=368405 RepID=A0ABS0WC65_9ALTE|nr:MULTISPECIES: siderophore-interacting protein [Paraglaciecola]MBJ2136036.1 siderophore-interacting protein [Paraglaciecola chathamensis]MBU3019519.1 siderophore-interacting protein [Paraglaciecola agarilytica]MDO6838654.1 siderophore-interacting protein [Paraglaciecola chathamensis]